MLEEHEEAGEQQQEERPRNPLVDIFNQAMQGSQEQEDKQEPAPTP